MIGVVCGDDDAPAAEELFELFKTPWERHQAGHAYDVVLSRHRVADEIAPVSVVFASPSAPSVEEIGGRTVVHLDWDLLEDVRSLLAAGRAPEDAATPLLDERIALLRRAIVDAGATVVEIPPVHPDAPLQVVLTHDIDFLDIRRHRFDRTIAGFLYRATVGSIVELARGRSTLRRAATNWLAAARLPLVQLGLARDLWRPFERYAELEGELPSTFFLIPFAQRRGLNAPAERGAPYGVAEVAAEAQAIVARGSEVAVHGIDAWADAAAAGAERREVAAAVGRDTRGVRMHWLYWDSRSPQALEAAGFDWDATLGYNEAVGFRAGTTQVYRPPGAQRLLELPLMLQDTSLFYPRRLRLSEEQAWDAALGVVDAVERNGGVLTVSWHERSLAPERQWGAFYVRLLDELRRRGARFTTAGDAVEWFRARRSVTFEDVRVDGDDVRVSLGGAAEVQPGSLLVRVHAPGRAAVDHVWDGSQIERSAA